MKSKGEKLGNNAEAQGRGASARCPNPRRVEAGKRNRAKWKGLTDEGRERLRQAALKNQPWRFSTGPRTPAGKARVAAAVKARQLGPLSIRQLRAEVAKLGSLVQDMREARDRLLG